MVVCECGMSLSVCVWGGGVRSVNICVMGGSGITSECICVFVCIACVYVLMCMWGGRRREEGSWSVYACEREGEGGGSRHSKRTLLRYKSM